jgi:hypothetical protein
MTELTPEQELQQIRRSWECQVRAPYVVSQPESSDPQSGETSKRVADQSLSESGPESPQT